MKPIPVLFWILAAAATALFLAGGCPKPEGGGTRPLEPAGDGVGPAPVEGDPEAAPTGDERKEEEAGGGGLLPGERRGVVEALETFKNTVFLNDPEGFEQGFLTVRDLKSIVLDLRKKEGWNAMLAPHGGDELEFEKHYRRSIRDFYDDLHPGGDRLGLSEAAFKAVKNSATPPALLLAQTFRFAGDRSRVVVLGGFYDGDALVGLLRLRAMPHQNRRPWLLVGDERLEAVDDLRAGESERVGGALRVLAAAQEGFRKAVSVDRDGDGKGECGFLAELAGVAELRGGQGARVTPDLPMQLREVAGDGTALTGGFLLRLFLPGAAGPVSEERLGAPEPASLTDLRETSWCALAWPAAKGCGAGLYLVGPRGVVLRAEGDTAFAGFAHAPPAAAAFGPGEEGSWGPLLDQGGTSGTGVLWKPLE